MRYAAMMLPLVAIAGCATTPGLPEPTGPCRVDEQLRMRFVGSEFRMNQREEIQYMANARIARVLREGDVTTMEFDQNRLNIHLDDMKRIEGLRCG